MKDVIARAKEMIGTFTPLRADCGVLCDKACCAGGDEDGMLLFPGESTGLRVVHTPSGRLAVCGGDCVRSQRPLACMLFPFFPCIDEQGRVRARIDSRAMGICPIAANSGVVRFSGRFIRRVTRAGEILAGDEQCARFMREITLQIEQLDRFYG